MTSASSLTAGLDNHIPPAVPATAAALIAGSAADSNQIVVFVVAKAPNFAGLGEISPVSARGIAARIRFGGEA